VFFKLQKSLLDWREYFRYPCLFHDGRGHKCSEQHISLASVPHGVRKVSYGDVLALSLFKLEENWGGGGC
jgi:hypothetical protein